jgi:ankyrin repeat protein
MILGRVLHKASKSGQVKVVEELIRADAPIEWKTTNGTTPLIAAAQASDYIGAIFSLFFYINS